MSPNSNQTVGQIERKTQDRVVRLFQDQLGYDYLGNWIDREGNRNIEPEYLRPFLETQGYAPALITRAIQHLVKVAMRFEFCWLGSLSMDDGVAQ